METVEHTLAQLKNAPKARILLVSDTHTRLDGIQALLNQIDPPDIILHGGDHQDSFDELEWAFDIPILGVAGNCDPDRLEPLPLERLIVAAGARIYLTHGHLQSVKTSLDHLLLRASKPPFEANIICFGHTHHQLIKQVRQENKDIWLLNPGSAYPSRGGAQGLLLTLQNAKISCKSLIDAKNP